MRTNAARPVAKRPRRALTNSPHGTHTKLALAIAAALSGGAAMYAAPVQAAACCGWGFAFTEGCPVTC